MLVVFQCMFGVSVEVGTKNALYWFIGVMFDLFVQGHLCCVFEPRPYSTNLNVHFTPTNFKIKSLLMQLDKNRSMLLLHMESPTLRSL